MTTAEIPADFAWLPGERNALTPPTDRGVAQWADECRWVTKSHRPGRWETTYTEYLREPMDTACDDMVDQATMVCAAQVGKTETLLNVMGYRICDNPGDMLYVMPRDDDWDDISRERVEPMLENTEAIWPHLRDDPDALTRRRLRFDRCTIYFAGANSEAGLASRPIHTVFLDEVDKYKDWAGKEADPVSLAKVRTRNFWNSKIYTVSTPTTKNGYIWQAWEDSDQRRFWIPCPHCGGYQTLDFFSGVKWPKEVRDGKRVALPELAYYECKYCEEHISDADKGAALTNGKWVQDCATIDRDGNVTGEQPSSHRGYHLPALYSRMVTWAGLAKEWLEAQGKPNRLQHFFNSTLAEPWQDRVADTKPDRLLELEESYDAGQVPNGARVLTAGVDLSEGVLYYEIRAWGVNEESWLVRYGRVETEEQIEKILFRTSYKTCDGSRLLQVRLACIDIGYDPRDRIKAIVKRWSDRARATRGAHHNLRGEIYKPGGALDRDYAGKVVGDGPRLWWLDTDKFKDRLARYIHARPGEGGYHNHRGTSEEWRSQMTAEAKVRVRKGAREVETWEPKTKGRPNHWLDTAVYAVAAAEMLGVPQLGEVDESEASGGDVEPMPGREPEEIRRTAAPTTGLRAGRRR